MSKAICIAIAVVGIILLVYGLNANNSFASSVSNSVSGKPTNQTIWLISLGVLGIVGGGAGLLFGRRGE